MIRSVPFTTDSACGGLVSCEGLARLEDGDLVLEFESKFLGMLPLGVREVRVPTGDIEDVEYLVRPFGPRLRLRARRIRAFSNVPGAHGPRLLLKHKARDDDEVRALAAALVGPVGA